MPRIGGHYASGGYSAGLEPTPMRETALWRSVRVRISSAASSLSAHLVTCFTWTLGSVRKLVQLVTWFS